MLISSDHPRLFHCPRCFHGSIILSCCFWFPNSWNLLCHHYKRWVFVHFWALKDLFVCILYLPIARFQFGSFRLSSQDVDAIHASVCTLFTTEHRLAKSVIIFQSGWAQRVSGTNPLSGRTWNYGIFSCGIHDFFLTCLNIEFTLFTESISCAITLKIEEKGTLVQCHLVLLKVTKTWADSLKWQKSKFSMISLCLFILFKNNVFPIYFYAFLKLFHAWFLKGGIVWCWWRPQWKSKVADHLIKDETSKQPPPSFE